MVTLWISNVMQWTKDMITGISPVCLAVPSAEKTVAARLATELTLSQYFYTISKLPSPYPALNNSLTQTQSTGDITFQMFCNGYNIIIAV